MRRVACLCGLLLLPLRLRGADPPAAPNSAHAWPVAAAAQRPAAPVEHYLAYPDTSAAVDQGVQALKETLARPAPPPRQSLYHVDLNRRLRLAFVRVPTWHIGVLGRGSTCVPILSLRW